ncbi:Hsp20/alpha crystallin family protein [Streptomyces sp. NPDC023588]|uniref:Hsp20/alpha crystallin family protein n=1 Tax=Streptomyces sp. NPDC023588 TaxID=3154907 RepID=UPI0033D5FDF5
MALVQPTTVRTGPNTGQEAVLVAASRSTSRSHDMEVSTLALPLRRGADLSERLRPSGDPFRDFENMWGEMGRLLEQAAAPAATVGGGGQWLPMAEEEETDDAYVVRMELPGAPGENVNIEIDDNELSISGEVSEEHRGKVLSRRTGKFSYRTSLPGTVKGQGPSGARQRVRLPALYLVDLRPGTAALAAVGLDQFPDSRHVHAVLHADVYVLIHDGTCCSVGW